MTPEALAIRLADEEVVVWMLGRKQGKHLAMNLALLRTVARQLPCHDDPAPWRERRTITRADLGGRQWPA